MSVSGVKVRMRRNCELKEFELRDADVVLLRKFERASRISVLLIKFIVKEETHTQQIFTEQNIVSV